MEFWLPYDVYEVDYQKKRPTVADRNTRTAERLRTYSEEYFKSFDEHLAELNKKYGKQVLFVVPCGQATIALRERIIAGKAPGLATQNELFTDAIGHPTPPLQALVAYCHFATIYRHSPVGLPMPAVLKNSKNPNWDEPLNLLLQKLAWDAVTHHPLSGVKTAP